MVWIKFIPFVPQGGMYPRDGMVHEKIQKALAVIERLQSGAGVNAGVGVGAGAGAAAVAPAATPSALDRLGGIKAAVEAALVDPSGLLRQLPKVCTASELRVIGSGHHSKEERAHLELIGTNGANGFGFGGLLLTYTDNLAIKKLQLTLPAVARVRIDDLLKHERTRPCAPSPREG